MQNGEDSIARAFLAFLIINAQAYPDALTYTLPVWAAVLNWYMASGESTNNGNPEQSLYLPPWVPPSERERILARLPALCSKLETALGGAGEAFREELRAAFQAGSPSTSFKPFRPVWVKHGDPLWMLPGLGLERGDGDARGRADAAAPPFIPIVCLSASREREPAEHREHFRSGIQQEPWTMLLSGGHGAYFFNRIQTRHAHSWPYIQGAADDAEHWASFAPPSPSGAVIQLTPGLFWRHLRAILPQTTAILAWSSGEARTEAAFAVGVEGEAGDDREKEDDGAVEGRVLALLTTGAAAALSKGAASVPVVRLWRVHETGLWVGDDASLQSAPHRWGGIVRVVPCDKEVVAERRERWQQQPEAPTPAVAGEAAVYEEIDEGEGRRGELAREGLPRAIVAFRRCVWKGGGVRDRR